MIDENVYFHSPNSGRIGFEGMIEETSSFIRREPKRFYKVIVGSDSPATGLEPIEVSIVTAIIVWRVGKGGQYFLTKSPKQIYYTRRDRIISETMNSLLLAQEIRSRLREVLGEEFLWDGNEIHADIGNGGETRVFIKEVTGLIRGFDFIPIIKPSSWGASTVADRYAG